MQTIRKTTSRRFPLLLKAAYEDREPYYLVDLAGYGVSWIKPAIEHRSAESPKSPYAGVSFTRHRTWIPIFQRARLAWEIVEMEPEVSAKLAKKIADKAWNRFEAGARGTRINPADVERFAWYLLDKERQGRRKTSG